VQRRAFLLVAAGVASSACLRSLRTPAEWRSDGPTPPLSPLAANPTRGVWPKAVTAAPAKVQEAYTWAVLNQPILRYIPCYCGCAGQGHKDNFDCYVSEAGEDGWIVLSDHAFG